MGLLPPENKGLRGGAEGPTIPSSLVYIPSQFCLSDHWLFSSLLDVLSIGEISSCIFSTVGMPLKSLSLVVLLVFLNCGGWINVFSFHGFSILFFYEYMCAPQMIKPHTLIFFGSLETWFCYAAHTGLEFSM